MLSLYLTGLAMLSRAVPCRAVLCCSVLCCAMQVMRLSSQDVPTAYAYELEAATIVQPDQVVAAVESMCSKVAATV
jgi:hypothetical protein